MAGLTEKEWEKVWEAALEIAGEHEDTVIIGGVAVYLQTLEYNRKDIPVEFTHDVDMAISLPTLGQLTEEGYEIVRNLKFNKRQITIGNVDVDIYVARQARLRFTYDELAEWAVEIDELNVACLAHLLLLKLDAFADRCSDKDRRDVAKLMVIIGDAVDKDYEDEFDMLVGTVTDDDIDLMKTVAKSQAFLDIAKKNAKVASSLRKKAQMLIADIEDAQT